MRTTYRPCLLTVAGSALLFASQAAASATSTHAWAQAASQRLHAYVEPAADADVDPDGLALQPGEFTWRPAAQQHSDSPVTLMVSLRDQRAYLYRDGERIAVTTVSTGKPGHDTPWGVFPITEKKKTHFSNRYNNAPMPYMQRLTRWGHALHAGQVKATPASHGCVRLPPEFAARLFAMTRRGDLVVIAHDNSMVSLERAGVDSQVARLVGSSSRLLQSPGNLFTRGEAVAPTREAGAALGTTAF